MNHRTSIFPAPGDVPRGYMGGTNTDIPVIDLHRDGDFSLAFHDLDAALVYLSALAVTAARLSADIRDHQRKTANLLTAVEATQVPS